MNEPQPLPILNPEEQRVLGSLMEKSRTTPDYYPMSLNGLTAACNQKSSRNPVVTYDEDTVIQAIDSLKKKGLVSTATGGSSRTIKYKHNFAIVFPLIPAEIAVICVLLLRGPQTPGEINTNAGRLFEFESLDEIQTILEKLASEEPQFVMQLPRRAGQKETRYVHLLGGMPDLNADFSEPEPRAGSTADLERRLTQVETELAEMKAAFEKLMKELMG